MSDAPAIVDWYGKLVKLWATDHYPLTLDYPVVDGLRLNATDRDGRPWDVTLSRSRPTSVRYRFGRDTDTDRDSSAKFPIWMRSRTSRSSTWKSVTGEPAIRASIRSGFSTAFAVRR
ncbi:hypothetical protein BRD22_11810 [Halobacteriales archaeon SW_8_68_21]|nr:MAG: hypothetical protein BRD22_11810 [Halobacteriales archaeon SW_8_68_21]